MSDPSQRDPSSETPPSASEWARSLDAEAMRRRIGARLFGDTVTPTYLGRFRVLRTLGVGGIGVVYAAEDDLLRRVVALKMIRDEVIAREGDRQRIISEARALARLSHPNVVQLHEVVSTSEAMFLVMEYVEGMTLLQWSRAERSVAEILAVFAAAARGLAAAHRVGIVHRDIKPSNIMIGEDARVRIVDFGLARRVQPASVDENDTTPLGDETPLSRPGAASVESGALGGTPAYMAPEAFIAGEIDASSDQFSFCVTLYEALYGVRPFGADTLSGPESMRRALTFPTEPRLSGEVRRLLARGLSARSAERFASMDEVTAILEPRPRSVLLGLVAVLLLGVLAGALLSARGSVSRCIVPVTKFAGVWDDDRRESLRRAMVLSGQPFAEHLLEPVTQRLDHYVEGWRAAHREACEASAVGEQSSELLDLSMICLEQRRLAVIGLVNQLDRGDPHIVSAALDLVHELPDIATCRDRERLRRERAPRSEEPRLASVRSLLMEAMARERSFEARAAVALADAALREVRATGDKGTESEVLLLRGRMRARELGELAAGRLDLHSAIDRAADAGDDALAMYAWIELAEVAAVVEFDADEARQSLAHAREAAGRHGPRAPEDEARLLDAEGRILWLEEDLSNSLQMHRRALALRQSVLSADHPAVLRSLHRVVNATADVGEVESAVALAAELRGQVARNLGVDHPATALIEVLEAQHLGTLGRRDEARRRLVHARPQLLRGFGARTPHLAMVDLELARIENAAGQLPLAIGRAREALRLIEDVLPRHHNLRIEALDLLANYYHRANDCSGVLDIQGQLLALHEERVVELDLPALLYNLGDCQCRLGRCSRGYEHFIRLLSLKPTGARRALALYGIAFVHVEDGQPLVALPLLKEARELLAAEPEELPEVAVDVARLLARALELLHREPRRVRGLRAEADALARKLAASQAG